jgi:hypothetical protein
MCAALLSSPASAQQFTFAVPIDVSNLPPNIDRMFVHCSIFSGTPLRPVHDATTYRETQIAIPQVPFPGDASRTVGTYRGDAVVTLNVRPGVDPSIVTHYRCFAQFGGTEGGAYVGYFGATNPISPRFPLVDGAPFLLDTTILPLPR